MNNSLDWLDLAACKGMDTELFFTSQSGPAAHREARTAYAICAQCPVTQRCAEYGANDQYGVWGGAQRTRVGTPYKSFGSIPVHGTEAAYKRHLKAGEEACRRCKDASTLASAERRARRRSA